MNFKKSRPSTLHLGPIGARSDFFYFCIVNLLLLRAKPRLFPRTTAMSVFSIQRKRCRPNAVYH